MQDNDIELIERCQRGEVSAFEGLFLKYQKRIFNAGFRMLGDYEEAADLCQEVFIRAYMGLKRFRGGCQFYTWLYKIFLNLCRNRLKGLKRERDIRSDSLDNPVKLNGGERAISNPGSSPYHQLEEKELQSYIQEAIESLPPEYRLVVILRDLQGLSYEDIAEISQSSIAAVKSRLHRARLILRERLKELI